MCILIERGSPALRALDKSGRGGHCCGGHGCRGVWSIPLIRPSQHQLQSAQVPRIDRATVVTYLSSQLSPQSYLTALPVQPAPRMGPDPARHDSWGNAPHHAALHRGLRPPGRQAASDSTFRHYDLHRQTTVHYLNKQLPFSSMTDCPGMD